MEPTRATVNKGMCTYKNTEDEKSHSSSVSAWRYSAKICNLLKQHIWKPVFHPWPLLPGIFSMDSYLLNQAHSRRVWKMEPWHTYAKVAVALASALLADVFWGNWWQPRTITIWPQSVFPDAPSSTPIHVRHSLMKWLSKTRYAFSCLLSPFTCYFHRLEYLVHLSSHLCLLITYLIVYWFVWGGGELWLQCHHYILSVINQAMFIPWYPSIFGCLYVSGPHRALGSKDYIICGYIWKF